MIVDSALKLASRQMAVIPLRPRSKSPLTRHAHKDATTDANTIAAWFEERPDANIGIATGKVSGVVVIDVDGEEGAKTLAEHERKHGPLPKTLTAATARGKHLYFEYPAGRIIPTSKKLGPGIDVKSCGGYVLAPPSVHPYGPVYKWSDADAEIQPLPAWMLATLTATGEKKVSKDDGKKVSKGDRQDALRKFACEVMNEGAGREELRDAVHLYNQEKCRPAKSKKQVDELVDWVLENHVPTDGLPDYDLDWFQFNCRQFLGDTNLMALTDRQMGWWVRLNAFAWMNRGVLPNDPDKLFRLSGAENKELFKTEMHTVLFEYEAMDGQLVNKKMAEHWQEKQELTKKRVRAGRARAEKAKQIPNEKAA